MTFTVAGHTIGTPDMPLLDALHLLKGAGLNAVEVIWQDGYQAALPESDNGQACRALQAMATDIDMEVCCLTPYMKGLNSLNRDTVSHDLDRFKRCIADAAELGCHRIRVYAGEYTLNDTATAAKWSALVANLIILGDFAEQHDVVLSVENHFNTMTVSAKQAVELMNAVSHPAVGLIYDQANLSLMKCEPPSDAIALQWPWIKHVHVKDFKYVGDYQSQTAPTFDTIAGEEDYVRSCVIGDGALGWAMIIRELSERGYDGFCSLEYPYRWHRGDLPSPAEGFRRGADYLRSSLS